VRFYLQFWTQDPSGSIKENAKLNVKIGRREKGKGFQDLAIVKFPRQSFTEVPKFLSGKNFVVTAVGWTRSCKWFWSPCSLDPCYDSS
jgi:hypothetical protein